MNRTIGLLSVVAVAALLTGPGQASGATIATIVLANYGCSDLTDLHATAGGGLWLDPGTGLALLPITQDVNMEIMVNSTAAGGPGTGWTDIVPVLGLSNHVITAGPYPGDTTYNGLFYADGGSPVSIPGGSQAGPYQFRIFAWTGSYTNPGVNYGSYNAAVNGTAIVGDSGVFEEQAAPAGGVDFGTSYNTGFLDMPAVLMRPSLAGDCNLDGRVNVNDLTIVLANYGQTTGVDWNRGNLNGDGKVDVNDLTIVLANYNRTAASAGAGGGVSAVPEPSALALIAFGALAPLTVARRRAA